MTDFGTTIIDTAKVALAITGAAVATVVVSDDVGEFFLHSDFINELTSGNVDARIFANNAGDLANDVSHHGSQMLSSVSGYSPDHFIEVTGHTSLGTIAENAVDSVVGHAEKTIGFIEEKPEIAATVVGAGLIAKAGIDKVTGNSHADRYVAERKIDLLNNSRRQ